MDFLRLPFYDAVADAKTVLLAGAGGGYDIFSGLPLYFGLRAAGKTVHLANLSFSSLRGPVGKTLGRALVEISYDSVQEKDEYYYFPEFYLAQWFHAELGEQIPIYCFDRVGARPIAEAYRTLVDHLGGVDAVILVDGGTDSLMRGDEAGLGTPEEDISSIDAVYQLEDIATKMLVCVGFGVDTFHGVCHAQFLEAVAELIRADAYLGAWSLTREMPEVERYRKAVDWVHERMAEYPSIVCSSVSSAVEGHFGNYHATFRTKGSELFINFLMSLYWAFHLEPVAQRIQYLRLIRHTETWPELRMEIERFRAVYRFQQRDWQSLPM